MTRNRTALTLLLGLGVGLAILTDMVGRPHSTAANSAALSQSTPTLSINDVSITEGNTGTSNLVFTVTLTASGSRPTIGVAYETADGPPSSGATAPSDYTRVSNVLMFPSGAGSTTLTISVPIIGDISIEPDEIFFVNLSRPDGATIVDAQGVGTIANDDSAALPVLSISDTTVTEGDSGTTDAVFTVTLTGTSSSTVTVGYATADSSATVADRDYMSRSGTLTFPAGDVSPKTILVPVIGDTTIEESESFRVNLTNPVGATIGDGQGSCLIFTSDAEECHYSLNPMSRTFPPTGGTGSFMVTTTSSCGWRASTVFDWITITSGAGTGDGSVTFSVAPNFTGDRTGFININGVVSFAVFQNDNDSCFISLDQQSVHCYEQGCASHIGVTAPARCNWTAISNAPWITITAGATGTGDGAVEYSVTRQSFTGPNPGPARTGTMTIAGQTVAVSQEGCSLSLDTDSQGVHYLAGTASVGVYSGCDGWTAVSNDAWIGIISTPRHSLGGAVTYSFLENTGGQRTGTIAIGHRTLTVVQIEAGPPCTLALTPSTGTASAKGGAGSISVTVPAGCPWTAVTDVMWITIDMSSLRGAGNGTIRYSVAENGSGSPSRQGAIQVNGQAHLVYQDAANCPLELLCSFFPGICLPDDQSLLAESRAFRDKVLARTSRGQRYTQLYYKFSTEAVSTLMLNPMLTLRSRDILERYRPVLESMIKGERVSLSKGDIEEIDGFLNSFAAKGGPELRDSLRALSEDLRDPQVHREFNITITDGSMRELPGQDTVQIVKQAGMMMAPIGLLLFCLYRLRNRRKGA